MKIFSDLQNLSYVSNSHHWHRYDRARNNLNPLENAKFLFYLEVKFCLDLDAKCGRD